MFKNQNHRGKIKFIFFLFLSLLVIQSSLLFLSFSYFDTNKEDLSQDELQKPLTSQSRKYFAYHKEITIDHRMVSGTKNLINFTFLISIYDTDLHDKVQADGDDIAFNNGSEWLDHEIETFDQTYNSTHAHLVAWVRIPSLSPIVDTILYMYYGNSTMGPCENPSGVWNDDYKGVWHLNENSGNARDSSNYNVDGILSGDINQGIEGKIDGSYEFNGNNDQVAIGDPSDGHLDFGTNSFTVSYWLKFNGNTSNYQLPLYKGATTDSEAGYDFETNWEGSTLEFRVSDGSTVYSSPSIYPISNKDWIHIVGVLDKSENLLKIYKDGTEIGSGTDVSSLGNIDNGNDLLLSPDTYSLNGTLDEIRIINRALSSDWIATEYNNQYNPHSFYTIGVQKIQLKPEYFKYHKEITIDHTKVSGSNDLLNFPVLVSIFDTDLHDKTQPDGDDIAFYNGSQWLDHEIEVFNQTYNATHAQLVAWVRLPLLSPLTDTIFEMYYGNSTLESQENETGVWIGDYTDVWHFNENSNNHTDSALGITNGIINGTVTQDISGKIGGADQFVGPSSVSSVEIIDSKDLNEGSTFTVQAWIYPEALHSLWNGLVETGRYTDDLMDWTGLWIDDSNNLTFGWDYRSGSNLVGSTLVAKNWYYVVAVYNGTYQKLYLNGVLNAEPQASTLNNITDNWWIGTDGNGNFFDGIIDEVRISHTDRSAGWILTEYNNQFDPNSFYTLGEEKTQLKPEYFKYYKEITIDHTKVSGSSDLLNFPMLISIYDSDLQNYVQPDGDDIAFYNGSEWLDYEIELFNQTYNATHAQLIAWVRIPSLSPTIDTVIRMYYGNSTMGSQENPNGVWDNNYVAVYHLNKAPTGTGIDVFDSSFYRNDGITNGSMGDSNLVNSQIGKGFEFDGIDDFINVSQSTSLDSTNDGGTISLWINWENSSKTGEYQRIMTTSNRFNKINPPHKDGFEWSVNGNGDTFFYPWGGDGNNYNLKIDPFTNGLWHNAIITFNYSIKNVSLYLDGSYVPFDYVNVTTHWTQLAKLEDWLWGASVNVTQLGHFEGKFDEIQVSNIPRSEDWIITEYNNQYNPNNFYSISPRNKTLNINDFTYYKKITIDNSKVSGSTNLVNFPVLISLFDTDLHNHVQADGDDIAFYNGNEWLDHEIEVFNQTYNATDAQLIAWVRIPSLSPINDTTLYMYYGNPNMGSCQNPEGVWDDNYRGVWHLKEDPTDPSPQFQDSTYFDNDGIAENLTQSNSVQGLIDGAIEFDDYNERCVNISHDASLQLSTDMTISVWIKANDTNGSEPFENSVVLAKWSTSGNRNYWMGKISGSYFCFYVDDTQYVSIDINKVNDNKWHYITGIADSTNNLLRLYVDGVQENASVYSGNSQTGVSNLQIGKNPGQSGQEWNGTIDEVRISNTIHSTDWILTEYDNQYDPYNFFTIGTENLVSGPPIININSPSINDLFGAISPTFDVEITDNDGINNQWYTIDGGLTNYTFIGSTGTIDQTTWEGQGNGTVTIRFYANDSVGNLAWNDIIVRKDIDQPSIGINNPTSNELLGTLSPDFNVTITDPSGVHMQWYTIDGGVTNYTFIGSTGTIDQTTWEGQGNGTVTIRFYANDSVGNLAWNDIIVRKDIDQPSIGINTPTSDELFGTTSPNFDVTITDSSGINTQWYTIDGGITNYTFVGSLGTIDQTAWEGQGNGTVTIRFYANDSAGNLAWNEVTIRKDINTPLITINNPTSNELFGTTSPDFDVTITDSSGINTQWYTIDGGITNYTFIGSTGTIDQTAWEGQGNGTITIRFYCNDSAGNLAWNEVTIRKDINTPLITINNPTSNELFGTTSPDFDVTITDSSGINTQWYTIDGGITNYTFVGSTGTIDQTAWEGQGNGTVTIRFYANDSAGNLAWNEVIIRKDIDQPSIGINNPTSNELFGTISPNFNVTIIDPSGINTQWYTIDGGITNYTFLGSTGTIDQTAWEGQGNGTITIRFYCNDSAGNLAWNEVIIRKDIDQPLIGINTPASNELFGTTSPDFDVTITDSSGINTQWYTIDGGITNYTFVGSLGTIDQTAWEGQGNGTITIRFYCNDSAGNLAWNEVTIRKDINTPLITINNPTSNELFGTTSPDFDVTITDSSGINTQWYTIDGGITNYTFVGSTGTIDQTAWEGQGNGTVTIRFYANDSAGNLAWNEVIIRKDINTPLITINNPTSNELFGTISPNFNVTIIDPSGIHTQWYTIDEGITNFTFVGSTGIIDQTAWENLGNGTVTIRFYANDSVGNVAWNQIIVRKDIILPNIDITNPPSDGDQIGGSVISISGMAYGTGSNIINIYINDTRWGDGSQMPQTNPSGTPSGTFVFTNNTYIIPGFYWIKINITDAAGNFNTSIRLFQVIAEDTTAPILVISSISPDPTNGYTEIIVTSNEDLKFSPLLNITLPNNSVVYRPMILISNLTWRANYTVDMSGNFRVRINGTDNSNNVGYTTDQFTGDIDSPSIGINNPTSDELFGTTSPNFNVTITDSSGINTQWYTIDGGITNYTFIGSTGTIDQTAWEGQGNGTITIRFYCNDSAGNLAWNEVIIRKDIDQPLIGINTPASNELFGTTSPNFDVTITDSSGINTQWYTIDGGITNYTFLGSTGIIDQTAWVGQGNGTVTIRFYANDSAGNHMWQEVIVRKDIINPRITIEKPTPYEIIGETPPATTLSIIEPNQDTIWYQLTNGTITTENNTWTGMIDPSVWSQIGNGTLILRFYINDSAGNINSTEINLRKDIILPKISIIQPTPNELFGETPPVIIISIIEPNHNSTWYQLTNGTVTTENYTWTGIIDPSVWSQIKNGTIIIRFYANDSVGNIGFTERIVRKNVYVPYINILSPQFDKIYNSSAPTFSVSISGVAIISTWYTLDGGITNYTFTELNGTIAENAWEAQNDGNVIIDFYLNNSLGKIGFEEVSVIKDTIIPKLVVNSPLDQSFIGESPILNIETIDANFESLWCTINSRKVLIESNVSYQISIDLWNALDDGMFEIFLFANDSVGHLNNSIVLTLYKDTTSPDPPVLLISPEGEVSGTLIFDWEDGSDFSGIESYRIIIDTEVDPFSTPGFVYDILINNTGEASSYYELKEDLSPGTYYYFIYQIDGCGHQSNSVGGFFIISSGENPNNNTNTKPPEFPWMMIIIIIGVACAVGVISGILIMKKVKSKKSPLYEEKAINAEEMRKLREKRERLDKEAKLAFKAGDYETAAELYGECTRISNDLFRNGYKIEARYYKEYKNLEIEARSKLKSLDLTSSLINNILTIYFNNLEMKYYSNPEIYPENQNTIDGLILNENDFIQQRLYNTETGKELIREVGIDPTQIDHIKAIQFIYTSKLSEDTIINYCKQFQHPEMLLFIIGIDWPAYQYEETMIIPHLKTIKYRENIRVIKYTLFFDFIGLDDQNRAKLNDIIESEHDPGDLESMSKSLKVELYDTSELKEDLKQKKWFLLI